jgi:hypothetical protein
MITSETVKRLFDYKEGNLYWKAFKSPNATAGSLAGHVRKDGYCRISIDGKSYLAHRLIWLWHGRELPEKTEIDHIDRNKSNNNIDNLRLATRTQNERNKVKKGYRFEAGKWRAKITINGKDKHLGMFDTEDEARIAYLTAAKPIHGEYLFRSNV